MKNVILSLVLLSLVPLARAETFLLTDFKDRKGCMVSLETSRPMPIKDILSRVPLTTAFRLARPVTVDVKNRLVYRLEPQSINGVTVTKITCKNEQVAAVSGVVEESRLTTGH